LGTDFRQDWQMRNFKPCEKTAFVSAHLLHRRLGSYQGIASAMPQSVYFQTTLQGPEGDSHASLTLSVVSLVVKVPTRFFLHPRP
jgi:hypothetical protein